MIFGDSMERDLCNCKTLFQMICDATTSMEEDLHNTTAIQGEIENDTTTSMEGGLRTIAIQGIGGLGKTTLTKDVFEDEEIRKHFGKNKIWISVSENFDILRILKEMLQSVTASQHGLSNTRAIISKLEEKLKGEKFILVLDDVWERDQGKWDALRSELKGIGDLSKSLMLITTRETKVATNARANHIHHLTGLSDDDGWELLLRQKAFIPGTSTSSQQDSKFKEIGIKIVRKCGGVPLAIKAMVPLLRSKKNLGDWETILEKDLSELSSKGEENYILPSLRLSYHHLPSESVKQCFAYCAIFPKDTELDMHVLINLWMAQGFLCKSKRDSYSSMEDLGVKYFADLLNNSFLQEEKTVDEVMETKSYKMHDLVHDLAIDVSKKDLFVWKADSQLQEVVSDVRHIVINVENEFPTEVAIISKLRTMNFCGGVLKQNSITCAQYMRVLILANLRLSNIPIDIEKLVHLRYLDVSGNSIHTLPESICKLYQLQALILNENHLLKELPRELCKLENLRHIDYYTSAYTFAFTSNWLLASRGGLRFLTKLQTLPSLRLSDGDEGWTIDELEWLNEIKGRVNISGVEHVKSKDEARKASIGSKGGISILSLEWSRREGSNNNVMMNNIDEDVLDSLKPHPNNKAFKVKGFMGEKFPSWIRTLNNLISVTLINCERCKQLPTLGQLPLLKILYLEGMTKVESIGNEFYHDERSIHNTTTTTSNNSNSNIGIARKEAEVVFGALRDLLIDNFESLTTWMTPDAAATSAFPRLENLIIYDCRILEAVPTLYLHFLKHLSLIDSGMRSIPQELFKCSMLEPLEIQRCENLKSITVNGDMMMPSLQILLIRNCENLKSTTVNGDMMMPSLKNLTIINCPALSGNPNLSQMPRLEVLWVENAGEEMMMAVGRSLQKLHQLTVLGIGGFRDDKDMMKLVSQIKPSTHPLPLKEVMLKKWRKVKNVPQQIQHLLITASSTLRQLTIWGFDELEAIPDWIGNLSSLQTLGLWECKELKNLPSKQAMLRLSQLRYLEIDNCPVLKQRCDKHNDGPQSLWPNIQHIPRIRIDDGDVQDLG